MLTEFLESQQVKSYDRVCLYKMAENDPVWAYFGTSLFSKNSLSVFLKTEKQHLCFSKNRKTEMLFLKNTKSLILSTFGHISRTQV